MCRMVKLENKKVISKQMLYLVPNGIKRIEREIFKDAMNLEEISIPDILEGITEIPEKDFTLIPCDRCQRYRCIYGTEIHIRNSII
jgi:hypothetical protein